jgi:hypothetical protein
MLRKKIQEMPRAYESLNPALFLKLFKTKCKVEALGQIKSDNINRMITLAAYFYLAILNKCDV